MSTRLNDQIILAHRVAAILVWGHGDYQVDHINGDRRDNRLCNLRMATASQNAKNQKKPKNNTSGIVGVSYIQNRKRWTATIGSTQLGKFKCFADALRARRNAEIEHGYHANHGRAV